MSTIRTAWSTRTTYLLVALGVLALVASLSGTAYALGKGSVDSKAIKNGSVKSADLAKNAVVGKKVRDGSLTGADLGKGSVRSGNLADGSVGASQLGAVTTVRTRTDAIIDADGNTNGGLHGTGAATATCPAGTRVLSGGALWVDYSGDITTKNVYLHSSYRLDNGWTARGIVDFGAQGNVKLEVYVDCLTVAAP